MEINITSLEEAGNLLQKEIRDSGEKFKDIASSTGLNAQTVSKIYYGETRRPQFRTVTLLIVHFGYRIYVRKTNQPAVQLPEGVRKLEVRKERRM